MGLGAQACSRHCQICWRVAQSCLQHLLHIWDLWLISHSHSLLLPYILMQAWACRPRSARVVALNRPSGFVLISNAAFLCPIDSAWSRSRTDCAQTVSDPAWAIRGSQAESMLLDISVCSGSFNLADPYPHRANLAHQSEPQQHLFQSSPVDPGPTIFALPSLVLRFLAPYPSCRNGFWPLHFCDPLDFPF